MLIQCYSTLYSTSVFRKISQSSWSTCKKLWKKSMLFFYGHYVAVSCFHGSVPCGCIKRDQLGQGTKGCQGLVFVGSILQGRQTSTGQVISCREKFQQCVTIQTRMVLFLKLSRESKENFNFLDWERVYSERGWRCAEVRGQRSLVLLRA